MPNSKTVINSYPVEPNRHKKPTNIMHSIQIFLRKWNSLLTPAEYSVAAMIFDRTLMWGKEWEKIPERHFLEGVQTKKGSVNDGISLSRPTLLRTLKSLISKGAVRMRSPSNCRVANEYALNMNYGVGEVIKLQTDSEVLNLGSKSEPEDVSNGSESDLLNGFNGSESDPRKKNKRKEEESLSADAQDVGVSTPRERAQKALNQSLSKKRKSRSARARKNTPDGWETVWRDEYEKCYPASKIAKWRGKEFGIMKNIHARLNDELVKSGDDFNEFLRFCVRRWQNVLLTRGTSARSADLKPRDFSRIPRVPSVTYLSPCLDNFTEAWVREGNSNLAHLSEEEKAISKLMYVDDLDYVSAVKAHSERQARKGAAEQLTRELKEVDYIKQEALKKRREAYRHSIANRNKHKKRPRPSDLAKKPSQTNSELSQDWKPLPTWDELHRDESIEEE